MNKNNDVTHWIIWVLGDPEKIEAARDFSLQIVNPGQVGTILSGVSRKESTFTIAGDRTPVLNMDSTTIFL